MFGDVMRCQRMMVLTLALVLSMLHEHQLVRAKRMLASKVCRRQTHELSAFGQKMVWNQGSLNNLEIDFSVRVFGLPVQRLYCVFDRSIDENCYKRNSECLKIETELLGTQQSTAADMFCYILL